RNSRKSPPSWRAPVRLPAQFHVGGGPLLVGSHHFIPRDFPVPIGGGASENRSQIAAHGFLIVVDRLGIADGSDEELHVFHRAALEGIVLLGAHPFVLAGD